MPMKVREVIALLKKNGWRLDRQKGSHRQFVHAGKAEVVTVAGNEGTDVPRGTLNDILKKAGLK